MASFIRTVQLAQRTGAQIDISWQGSTFAFAMTNMPRFAGVLADLLNERGVDSAWVTLFNEPNSTNITLPQYEQVYRELDASLQALGVRDRIHFMGGDLVGTTSPLGQSQVDWFTYMAAHMGDLLDGWSVHIYWGFWEPAKIDRRLATEVRMIFAAIPAQERRPLFVTEFGTRGDPLIPGLSNFQPGSWVDGTPMAQTTAAAFQEGWFMLRAAQLGFSGLAKWDLDNAKYDNGTQDFSAIGPGADGWLLRPSSTTCCSCSRRRRSRSAGASSTYCRGRMQIHRRSSPRTYRRSAASRSSASTRARRSWRRSATCRSPTAWAGCRPTRRSGSSSGTATGAGRTSIWARSTADRQGAATSPFRSTGSSR